MKKIISLLSVVLMFALLLSVPAFAADVSAPGNTDLPLTATVDPSTTYTISIPSTTQTIDITSTAAISVGTVTCSAFSTNAGKKVQITASQQTPLTNDTKTVGFTVTDNATITFNAVDTTGKDVKITLNSADQTGLIAGTYNGTLRFAVSVID